MIALQAHVCISNTSRAGAELGYDVSVIRDGIGDRDIPGATAKQLVDVSILLFIRSVTSWRLRSWVSGNGADLAPVQTVVAELGDVSATIIESKDL